MLSVILMIVKKEWMINMGIKYTVYICICILFIFLSLIDTIYPLNRILLEIVYLLTWGTLLILELKKMFVAKKRDEKSEGYFSVVIILFIMISYIIDMLK